MQAYVLSELSRISGALARKRVSNTLGYKGRGTGGNITMDMVSCCVGAFKLKWLTGCCDG